MYDPKPDVLQLHNIIPLSLCVLTTRSDACSASLTYIVTHRRRKIPVLFPKISVCESAYHGAISDRLFRVKIQCFLGSVVRVPLLPKKKCVWGDFFREWEVKFVDLSSYITFSFCIHVLWKWEMKIISTRITFQPKLRTHTHIPGEAQTHSQFLREIFLGDTLKLFSYFEGEWTLTRLRFYS